MWEAELSQSGYRLTQSRRAVMQTLEQTRVPLCPQEILEQSQALHAALGLVTVYRTLNLLVELGLVRRIHRQDGCHAYWPASPGHHHAVVCTGCGQAVEFQGDSDLELLVRRVEQRTGFDVQEHLLQLFGLCPNCRQRQSQPPDDTCSTPHHKGAPL